jgi:acyl carrier protein
MAEFASARIRKIILESFTERGMSSPGENDSLFSSGLLDSLTATEVLVALETDHGIDLADEDFDILAIDTLSGIEALVASHRAGAPMDHAAP